MAQPDAREPVVRRLTSVSDRQVAELAELLLTPERLSAAGIGPTEERFAAALEPVNPALAAAAA